jgi:hypothetical protein
MSRILLLFFVLNSFLSISQTQSVKGKVLSDGMVGDILVINLSRETETKTDALGQFIIEAQSGDLLIFSAEFIHKKRYLVEEIDFSKLLEISVEAKPIEMETVELNFYNDIDAVSLGILQEAPKEYTHLEKKLITASNIDPRFDLGTSGGVSMNLDPIINAITGKTKRLKNLVDMEREDKRVEYLSSLFNDEFFIQKLSIPKEYLTEFKYYAAYHLKGMLPSDGKSTSKTSIDKIEVELIPLARKYLELQEETEK